MVAMTDISFFYLCQQTRKSYEEDSIGQAWDVKT